MKWGALMRALYLAALAGLLAGPALAQSADPQQLMDDLLRQKQIEMRQQFQERQRQRQRQLDEQEQAYDRQECQRAGYRGPDVEQCVRDSAAWRRGYRPAQPAQPDFSAYGVPVDDQTEHGTSAVSPNRPSASRLDVPLRNSSGIFAVPVEINGAITLDFAVDSGAADVSIPLDVFSTLKRAGTVRDTDILGQRTYGLADGSKSQSVTFRIRSLKVGDRVLENVTGSVAPSGGMLLLGQSFLGRFKAWSIDNARHKLVLEPQ
jgi:clan AA aspartic protease (TIGR02281 family)